MGAGTDLRAVRSAIPNQRVPQEDFEGNRHKLYIQLSEPRLQHKGSNMIFDHNRSSAEINNVKFRRLKQFVSEGIQVGIREYDQLFGILLDREKRIGENR